MHKITFLLREEGSRRKGALARIIQCSVNYSFFVNTGVDMS